MMLAEKIEKWPQCALTKDIIAAGWAVTSNITKSPYCLFADIKYWGRKEIDEFRDCVGLDNDLSVFSSARSDVSQCPGSFKLSN